jgi:hypothetical protein
MGYFRFFALKDGAKLKKNKLKGDTNIILRDRSIILEEQNYFFGIFKDIFQNFGGTNSRRGSAPGSTPYVSWCRVSVK